MRKTRISPSLKISTAGTIGASLILAIAYIGVELYHDAYPNRPSPGEFKLCFTPDKECQKLILREINHAKKSIFIQAYSFTDSDIGEALTQAKQRNVDIHILLDKSNRTDSHSLAPTLIQQGFKIRFDSPSGIAHSKIMIIDQQILITGSYNFSKGAYSRNTENLLIFNDAKLAGLYLKNWHARWDLSHQTLRAKKLSPKSVDK